MAMTNDEAIADRMRRLRTHGITRDPALMSREPDGPWYYEQLELGLNYRMTDIHAALGLSQLDRLGDFIGRRHSLVRRYNRALEMLPIVTPWQHVDSQSAWHHYVVRLESKTNKENHRRAFEHLRKHGVRDN